MSEANDTRESGGSSGPAKEWTGLLIHLTGSRQGAVDTLPHDQAILGTDPEADIHFAADKEPEVGGHHAELTRDGSTFELHRVEGRSVWVNGEAVERLVLTPGDIIRLGDEGPVLRYRPCAGRAAAYKTPVEALADCFERARYEAESAPWRAGAFLGAVPHEFGQTAPVQRARRLLHQHRRD